MLRRWDRWKLVTWLLGRFSCALASLVFSSAFLCFLRFALFGTPASAFIRHFHHPRSFVGCFPKAEWLPAALFRSAAFQNTV